MKKSLKKVFGAVVALLVVLLCVACSSKPSMDGRWESPEYKESMREKLAPFFSSYNLDIDDYYSGGSSAIVIKGETIRYETVMNFDLRAAAKAISKANPNLGTPEEIEKQFFNPTAVYDAEKGRVTEIIFEGVMDAKEGTITLSKENHFGLEMTDIMTYEVDGEVLTIKGGEYTHKFIRK